MARAECAGRREPDDFPEERPRGNPVVLQIENPCEDPMNTADGTPKPAKENKAHRGFGPRSMPRLAEKREGHMSARAENCVF